jgi:hypothetical protein
MNKIGKILVFVNLAFSVITGALIVMVFATRTNWEKGYNNVRGQLVGEQAKYTASINDANKLLAAQHEQLKLNDQKLGENDKQLKAATADMERLKGDLEKETKEAGQLRAQRDKLLAERDSLNAEVKRKDELVATQLNSINELLIKSKNANDQMIRSKIDAESTRARLDNLLGQYEKLLKEFEGIRNDKAVRAGAQPNNPPPEDVKGTVKATDAASGLVTVNLGSDNGLTKGNTLQVYRLAPRPTYVGQMRIVDVRPNEAVGKLVSAARPGAIQIGDEVASKILDNR